MTVTNLQEVALDPKQDAPSLGLGEMRKAWWGCLWLNMCVLWAYQSLLSAQNIYVSRYPGADIDFWGTVLTGLAMSIGQAVSMLGRFDERGGFDMRVQGAYIAFGIIGLLVLGLQFAWVILAAFGLTGLINTISESKLYTLAAWGGDHGELTGAVQLGNGMAGLLNLTADLVIRIVVLICTVGIGNIGDHTEETEAAFNHAENLAMQIFLVLLAIMCFVCIPVYRYMTQGLPTFKQRIDSARAAQNSAGHSNVSFMEHFGNLRRVAWSISGAVFAQFACFFISLSIFPGMACAVPLEASVFGPGWYCSPCVIGSFNYADFFGRYLATFPWMDRLLKGPVRLYGFGGARVVFVPWIILMCLMNHTSASAAAPWIVLIAVFLCGLTNGIVSSVSMMRAPMLVPVADREMAAQIMVLALYCGIAGGSMFSAILHKAGVY